VKQYGFPVVVKPDNGVGAAGTFKLKTQAELEDFLSQRPDTFYFMETFVKGEIVTYDGLTDQEGNIVFDSSMVFSLGIMETVNDNLDMTYYIPRVLPPAVTAAGEKAVKAFGLRERFFHMEFFLTDRQEIYALEMNVRPPGGMTVDMFNYANDIDIFSQYAQVVTDNAFTARVDRPYNCFYLGRKDCFRYARSPEAVAEKYPEQVVCHSPIDSIFSAAIGNYGFIVRTPDMALATEILEYAMAKAPAEE